MKVLDHGHIKLIDSMGSDIDIVNAARTSFDGTENKMNERNIGLVNFLMKNKHGCYDDQTEVLTTDGWKRWPDVTGEEMFYTINPSTHSIEIQAADRVVHRDINGPMIRIFKPHSCDMLVTPDHKMLAAVTGTNGKKDGRYELRPARELLYLSHRMMVGGGEWNGGGEWWHERSKVRYHKPDLARLIGMFIGDGSLGSSVSFNVRKERKRKAIRRAIELAGYESTSYKSGAIGVRGISDGNHFSAHASCAVVDGQKRIPSDLLHEGSTDELIALFEGLMETDGNTSPSGRQSYSTTSNGLADDIQILAVKIGRAATMSVQKDRSTSFGDKPLYRLTIWRERKLQPRFGWTKAEAKEEMSIVNYSGGVHCVTVPNGTLYVRRNGKPMWCGNTPFEMVEVKFDVKAPIFVFREWHRHRIASINEMSGRYVELPQEYYIPQIEQIREQKGKPGAYYFEPIADTKKAESVRTTIDIASNNAFNVYNNMLKNGIAKEVARLVLPVNTYSKMVWKTNLRAAMNFVSLRNHEHAQWEIREYAKQMEKILQEIAPYSMQSFIKHGRKQP